MNTPLEISLDPTPASSGLARRVLHAAYADAMPAVALLDLKTIVSELVTNSCRFGPGAPIRLSIEPDEDELRGEVIDGGGEAFGMKEIGEEEGLGLHIVDALATDWDVATEGGSVRFTLATTA